MGHMERKMAIQRALADTGTGYHMDDLEAFLAKTWRLEARPTQPASTEPQLEPTAGLRSEGRGAFQIVGDMPLDEDTPPGEWTSDDTLGNPGRETRDQRALDPDETDDGEGS